MNCLWSWSMLFGWWAIKSGLSSFFASVFASSTRNSRHDKPWDNSSESSTVCKFQSFVWVYLSQDLLDFHPLSGEVDTLKKKLQIDGFFCVFCFHSTPLSLQSAYTFLSLFYTRNNLFPNSKNVKKKSIFPSLRSCFIGGISVISNRNGVLDI